MGIARERLHGDLTQSRGKEVFGNAKGDITDYWTSWVVIIRSLVSSGVAP